MKRCRECGKVKSIDDFYNRSASPDGKQGYCKPCQNVRKKRYDEKNPSRHYATRLKAKYGITIEDYEQMLAEQGGCAICGAAEPFGRSNRYFHVDHCHTTGRVRGVLCANCNTALGLLGDDPQRLAAAVRYLEAA